MISMRKNKKNLLISLFLLFILSMGIGYAYLTSNLSILGNTEIASNSWDIHFANLNVTNGSVEATTPAAIDPTDNTSITYTVKLNRPKQFYEFTVDVVNEGTLPGKVSISTLSGITSEAEDIVLYTVNYTNGNPVQVGDILNGGATKHIKVKVYYNDEIDIDDLPSTNINLTLTYILQFVQSEEDEETMNSIITNLVNNNESCIYKYTGNITDQVGVTKQAENVYFNRCVDKRNIIFNNMCWQMIRTTETGGIKMIYNGDPVDGKCESTRGDHKGIVQSSAGSFYSFNSSYLYGSTFTYDITNSTFTLTDTEIATWSDSTYEDLIGKFTCKTSSDTCTTLYEINGYFSNTDAFASNYRIADTNYAQIGKSSFNANSESPAMVGYMFNKVYNYKSMKPATTEYKYGSTYIYSNGTYTLSGTIKNLSNWSTGYNTINDTHYTCWNTTGTCNTLSYIYYTNSTWARYYELSEGILVNDLLEEMLFENGVNKYNSSIKGIIDAWYKQNMLSKTNMLEDTVYCNVRNISNYGGFDQNGGDTTSSMSFTYYYFDPNLVCQNETDQFSVSNNKAKLTYPISLLDGKETTYLSSRSLIKTGATYWTLSPSGFYSLGAILEYVLSDGNTSTYASSDFMGTRPVVSLLSSAVITDGDGSEERPWVVE